jgi:hypothetical protein
VQVEVALQRLQARQVGHGQRVPFLRGRDRAGEEKDERGVPERPSGIAPGGHVRESIASSAAPSK